MVENIYILNETALWGVMEATALPNAPNNDAESNMKKREESLFEI